MKLKHFALLAAALIVFSGCNNPFMEKLLKTKDETTANQGSDGPYTGPPGSGTAGDPWIVHDVVTLQKVGSEADGWNLDSHYRQVRNIDLAGEGNWTPIGDSHTPFSGIYNGGNFTITNLTVNPTTPTNHKGMFGRLNGINSEVKNIRLRNYNVSGDDFIGGVAGLNEGGRVENCYITGTSNISGKNNVGGIVGNSYGTNAVVKDCYIACTVTGYANTGGIVGLNDSGATVQNSNSTGTISGTSHTGGIVGDNTSGSTVQNCNSTGNVEGNDDVGGVAGHNAGTVEACYVMGSVSGGNKVGGVVGFNNGGSVRNCHITGTSGITGNTYVGGIVGSNELSGTMQDCDVKGNVNGSNQVGGVSGFNSGTVQSCHATSNVTGTGNYAGGVVGYNRGRVEECYATGGVKGSDNVGGVVGHSFDATVKSCYATGDVNGVWDNIGGVVGFNEGIGTVEVCYASGSVKGANNVGGVVGNNNNIVKNCYSMGNVEGSYGNVGGVVGYNTNGTVLICYATGNVKGDDGVGGVVGFNRFVIQNCMALNSNISANSLNLGRVVGNDSSIVVSLDNNFGYEGTKRNGVSGASIWNDIGPNGTDGEDITADELKRIEFMELYCSDFTRVPWNYENNKLPGLIGLGGQNLTMPEHIR